MEIKALSNLSSFSEKELNQVIKDCDIMLVKMTAIHDIDEVLFQQEAAIAELQKRTATKNE